MKKFLYLLLFLPVMCFAQSWDTSGSGSIYNLTVTSMTSKAMFTLSSEQGLRRIIIDNRSGYTMYLSTFSASVATLNSMYPILSSTDATKPLVILQSSGFTHVISSAGVPSTSGVYVIIEK